MSKEEKVPKSVEERAKELYPQLYTFPSNPSGYDWNEDARKAYIQCAKDFRVGELIELLNKVVKMQRSTFGHETSLHLKLAVLVKEIEQFLKQE